jgi:hypothetical protein
MTAWRRFYPVFFTVIKNMVEEVKLFTPPSYNWSFLTNRFNYRNFRVLKNSLPLMDTEDPLTF